MLFHFSFSARDPARVATALAELLGARVIACPTPPFPAGSRFVCCGDDRGTMVEILPAGTTYAPGPNGNPRAISNGKPAEATAVHGLFLATGGREQIEAVARRENWPCTLVDTGLFKVIAVWLEGNQLMEFTTPELLPDYLATYGSRGIETLDAKLRVIELELTELTRNVHGGAEKVQI